MAVLNFSQILLHRDTMSTLISQIEIRRSLCNDRMRFNFSVSIFNASVCKIVIHKHIFSKKVGICLKNL
jgi:hypothetical protein